MKGQQRVGGEMRRGSWLVAAMLGLCLVACSPEAGDWRNAQSADSIEAYDSFIAKYPQSEFAAQARERTKQLAEERDWQVATGADTADAYQQFLSQYPEGKWAQEARVRIENFNVMQGGESPAPAPAASASTDAAADDEVAEPVPAAAKPAAPAPAAAKPAVVEKPAAKPAATGRTTAPGTKPGADAGGTATRAAARKAAAAKSAESKKPSARKVDPKASAKAAARSGNPKKKASANAEAASRYTPPIPTAVKSSPVWVPILMFALLIIGALIIMSNYMGVFGDASNVRLVIGLGFILGGIVTATQYR